MSAIGWPTSVLCQRSYDPLLFDDAILRMNKAGIKSPFEILQFEELRDQVNGFLAKKQQDELDFKDIPDEFQGVFPKAHHKNKINVSSQPNIS